MRYIGSKVNLLDDINTFLEENIGYIGEDGVFCDIFSGTASVARYFKPKFEIISNDNLYFSYILQSASIEINQIPEFKELLNQLNLKSYNELKKFLEKAPLSDLQESYKISDKELFIYNNYCPVGKCERMYFKKETGKRLDIIRILLNKWLELKWINNEEFTFLLALLIETAPYYSNISGVYGAYLKKWDKRTEKEFEIHDFELIDNHKNNKSYNKDAHELIHEIKGDILYLDPPYNNRQYPPNYHVLETLARYDYPEVKGVSGMRDYSNQISRFCRKKEVKGALEDIIKNANFPYVIMSYSTDGLLKIEEIEEVFKKYGKPETFKMEKIKYRKYKSHQKQEKRRLHELLFFVEKDIPGRKTSKKKKNASNKNEIKKEHHPLEKSVQTRLDLKTNSIQIPKRGKIKNLSNIEYSTKDFLKCPFNYIGGKHRILPQLFTIFPKEVSTFVDLFGGGFNVGINSNADKIIYNDQLTPLVELYRYFQEHECEKIIEYIETTIEENNIKKEEKQGFLEFRKKYNESEIKNPLDLYILVCYSFNYQFRFNNKGEYNTPHGTNRSSFTKNMKSRLIQFINLIHEKDIEFLNEDFTKLDFQKLDDQSLVYCDPPYLITTGSYNDGNRGFKDWRINEEKQLLNLLDDLNKNNIKFALSNVTVHDGKINDLLLDWIEKNNYTVININSDYTNANYNKKNRENNKNQEVLVVNF